MSHENDLTNPLTPEALGVENLLRQFAVRLPGESDTSATAGSLDRDRLMYLAGMAAASAAATAPVKPVAVIIPASKTPWYWPAATMLSSSLAALFLAMLVSSKGSSGSPELAQLPPAVVSPVVIAPEIPAVPAKIETTISPIADAQALQAAAEQKKLQNQELRRICTMPAGSYFRNRYMALAGGLDSFAPAPYQVSIPASADAPSPALPSTPVPKLTPFGQLEELLRSDGVL